MTTGTHRRGKNKKSKLISRLVLWSVACVSAMFMVLQFVLLRKQSVRALNMPSSLGQQCNEQVITDAIQRLFYQPASDQEVDASKSSLVVYTGTDCVCDLISVDCLDSVQCIPKSTNQEFTMIAMGVMIRRAIKQMAVFRHRQSPYEEYPIGKGLQYSVIDNWKRWMETNELPIRYDNEPSIFANETWYKDFRARKARGKECFFRNVNATEDMYEIERRALKVTSMDDCRHEQQGATVERIAMTIQQFLNQSQDARTPLANLMFFAHMARMRFNLAPFVVHDLYKERLKSVIHKNSKPIAGTGTSSSIRVALHMRRADACMHQKDNYTTNASSLHSPAQTTSARHCYATSVYVEALERVASQYERVDVYLSTDYAGSVIAEMQADFGKVYKQMNWHFLNYTSDNVFNYEDVIESDVNDPTTQAILGESAIADLYHLSHGQVYIGHLGSRFGKVAWLLATARHNMFVPFFTVDGHSYCCEIDEACGDMKPYITTMENCMTFNSELSGRENDGDYWSEGSTIRRSVFKEQQQQQQHHAK